MIFPSIIIFSLQILFPLIPIDFIFEVDILKLYFWQYYLIGVLPSVIHFLILLSVLGHLHKELFLLYFGFLLVLICLTSPPPPLPSINHLVNVDVEQSW
jgi:hypothetical protein